MDKFKIDSHKLMLHVPRLNDWYQGKNIYPIYLEMSPSGLCNHRCTFCALDFMGYRKRFLDTDLMQKRFMEMGKLGVKSIMFGGEGEPLLNKDIAKLTQYTHLAGIDLAFTTNGVLLTNGLAEQIMGNVEWIKVSINAGTPDTYASIHRTRPEDFNSVINNLSFAAELKQKRNNNCVLGMQALLLPENHGEMLTLAEIARDIGMSYLVVKPYSQHPSSNTKRYEGIRYNDYLELQEALEGMNTDHFKAIFRVNTMKRWDDQGHGYDRCYALPFWAYIDSGGDVWGCSAYLGDERFLYGNINEESFQEIWEGERRDRVLRWVENELDAKQCRVNCRMDKINLYLWELKNPPDHVNFI